MFKFAATPQESIATNRPTISGPHVGLDADGALDHWFYRCESCDLESTDRRMQDGCLRCGGV